MLRKYTVTMELWRETFSGRDQRDVLAHIEVVVAATVASAIKKAERQAINPGKGMAWSHSIWARNAHVTGVADIRGRK